MTYTVLFAVLCLMAVGSNVQAAPPLVDCRVVLCALPTCEKPIPADPSVGRCCPICPDAESPTCPPDKPFVYCIINPCQVASCPAHPGAICIPDYCGGCNARFFDKAGNEVTKSCDCPVQGQVFTDCGSACPPNCTEPTPFCTKQCVARCQCPTGTVINEATNECVPVNQCPPKIALAAAPTCPPGKPLVQCVVNPCQFASCPAHPNAVCVADYCGGCNARFYDSAGNEVTDTCQVLSVARAQLDCPIEGQIFTECGSACPPTCSIPNPFCTHQCVPGCQCPTGTVLNEITNECVYAKACPR